MSNVSDTDEIVAACLLFPLARTFLIGGHKHPFPRFSPAAWPPARHGRFDWRAKALAWSEHLYQRPKYVVGPRNFPKRCASATTA